MLDNENIVKTMTIDGMMCTHCAGRVESVLKKIDGVTDVSVDLKSKAANVKLNKSIDNSILKDAVEKAGYTVTNIE